MTGHLAGNPSQSQGLILIQARLAGRNVHLHRGQVEYHGCQCRDLIHLGLSRIGVPADAPRKILVVPEESLQRLNANAAQLRAQNAPGATIAQERVVRVVPSLIDSPGWS